MDRQEGGGQPRPQEAVRAILLVQLCPLVVLATSPGVLIEGCKTFDKTFFVETAPFLGSPRLPGPRPPESVDGKTGWGAATAPGGDVGHSGGVENSDGLK